IAMRSMRVPLSHGPRYTDAGDLGSGWSVLGATSLALLAVVLMRATPTSAACNTFSTKLGTATDGPATVRPSFASRTSTIATTTTTRFRRAMGSIQGPFIVPSVSPVVRDVRIARGQCGQEPGTDFPQLSQIVRTIVVVKPGAKRTAKTQAFILEPK